MLQSRQPPGDVMLHFAQFGAGRIGAIHAANLAGNHAATLRHVIDVNRDAAAALAARHGATVSTSEAALADRQVNAVLIASSTDTHADLIIAAARAGHAIFCEKPIDLSLDRVDACLAEVERAKVPLMVAFNRRFDPSFASLRARVLAGEIGSVEQVIVTSRDPAPPHRAFIGSSGGMFRDMSIHDLDMARWLLGEEPIEVFAYGACLVDPMFAEEGDIDSGMILMRTASGRMAHINNTRRAVYGYDQRLEVFGSAGRLIADNRTATSVELADARAVARDKPEPFFLQRYAEAYRAELNAFISAVTAGTDMPVSAADGRQALVLAEAAMASMQQGGPVAVTPP